MIRCWPQRLDAQAIIGLYADHGTHEQFHAEFKTDLDLCRLPCRQVRHQCAGVPTGGGDDEHPAPDGPEGGLLGPDAPVRHVAKRRRLKTVMQELIYRAGRLIQSGRQLILGLGANDRGAKVFARLDGELFAASP